MTETKTIAARDARPGDNVDPLTLPAALVAAGGGWVDYGGRWNERYFCFGCHKDGYWGWRCTEVR